MTKLLQNIREVLEVNGYSRAKTEEIFEYFEKNLVSSLDFELIKAFSIKNVEGSNIFVKNKDGKVLGFSIKSRNHENDFWFTNLGNWYLETEIDEELISDYKNIASIIKENFKISKRFSYTSKTSDFEFDEKKSVFILDLKKFKDFEDYIAQFKVKKHRWTNDLLKQYSTFSCIAGEIATKEEVEETIDLNKDSHTSRGEVSPFTNAFWGVRKEFLYLGEKGLLKKIEIKLNGEYVSRILFYQTQKGIVFLNGHYDYEKSKLALRVSILYMIKYAIENGLEYIDMMTGDFSYKKAFLCTQYPINKI